MKKANIFLIIGIVLFLGALGYVIYKFATQDKKEDNSNQQLQNNDQVSVTNPPPAPPATTPPAASAEIKAGDKLIATSSKLSYLESNPNSQIIHRFKKDEYVGIVESITNSGLGFWVNNYSYVCTVADGSNYDKNKATTHYCVKNPSRIWITKYDVKKG